VRGVEEGVCAGCMWMVVVAAQQHSIFLGWADSFLHPGRGGGAFWLQVCGLLASQCQTVLCCGPPLLLPPPPSPPWLLHCAAEGAQEVARSTCVPSIAKALHEYLNNPKTFELAAQVLRALCTNDGTQPSPCTRVGVAVCVSCVVCCGVSSSGV
jgi:hypothetical protein